MPETPLPGRDPAESSMTAPPDDPQDARDELDEALAAAAKNLTGGKQASLDVVTQSLETFQATIDVKMFQPVHLDRAWVALVSEPLADASRDPQPYVVEQLQRTADQLLGQADSIASKQWNLQKFFASIFGMSVPQPALGVTYELFVREASGIGNADVPASDALKASVRAAYATLRAEPDPDFWKRWVNAFAPNASTPAATGLSAIDLFYWMQYTQQLFPLQAPWMWAQNGSNVPLSSLIQDVVRSNVGANPSDSLVLSRLMAGANQPPPLPRSATACAGALAFVAQACNKHIW